MWKLSLLAECLIEFSVDIERWKKLTQAYMKILKTSILEMKSFIA